MIELTNQEKEIIQLVKDYLEKLRLSIELLNIKSEKDKGFQIGYGQGYLDNEHKIKYAFHGYGCKIDYPEFNIDFDVMSNRRCDGFQAHFVAAFLRENQYVLKYDRDELYKVFSQLVDKDVFRLIQDSLIGDVFFFIDDNEQGKALLWKPYSLEGRFIKLT